MKNILRYGSMVPQGHTGAAPSQIASLLMNSDFNIGELRALSPLEENTQRIVDKAVQRVGLQRLTVVADLLSQGLRYPLSDPLGTMFVQWERQGETGYAQRTMNPSARGENQLPARDTKRVPIYITSDDFFLGIRTLRASERVGAPIDTSLVEQATRRVNEALEDAAINGIAFNVDGSTQYGLLNAPNANTQAYGSNEAWTASGHDGSDILADVLAMITKAVGDKKYGPYTLYVSTSYGLKLMDDFKANSSDTILQRLEQIQSGGANLRVRVSDLLPADKTVLVQMTNDVIEIVDGMRPTVVPWTSPDGFTLYWMVMAIMVPRIRDDYDGNSGIVIGNTT